MTQHAWKNIYQTTFSDWPSCLSKILHLKPSQPLHIWVISSLAVSSVVTRTWESVSQSDHECVQSPQAVSRAAHTVPGAALRSSPGETAGGFPWARTLSGTWRCRCPGTARQGPGCCARLWSAKRQVLADLRAHPTGQMVLFNSIPHNSKMHYRKQQRLYAG